MDRGDFSAEAALPREVACLGVHDCHFVCGIDAGFVHVDRGSFPKQSLGCGLHHVRA